MPTIESLAKDFELPVEKVTSLALAAGVPADPAVRELTQQETDRIYDALLLSEMPKPKNTKRGQMTMIDTSSLLHEKAPDFLKAIVPELQAQGRKIIVPDAVMQELSSKAIQSADTGLAGRAREIMRLVLEYRDMGAIAVYGDSNDGTFADNVFHKAAAAFALKYDLTVITQDYTLGQDLLMMRRMRSVHHRRINVCKLNSAGELVPLKQKGVHK